MNAFANAVDNQEARTANGMKARKSTSKAVVDLFYNIGASRGKNIIPQFVAALAEDKELAARIALWARDVRSGAGERQLFRDILLHLEQNDQELLVDLLPHVPELGRWDDILIFQTPEIKAVAFTMLGDALRAGNQTAAKWAPREKSAQGKLASEIRQFFGMTPKQYRKALVALTNVVETQMCAKDWDNINFSHVPSLAMSRYKKAFNKNTPKFKSYVEALVKGDDPKVKVNAGAVYPHDVVKSCFQYGGITNETEKNLIVEQWNALPNYVGEASILPVVDVSGSMDCPAGGSSVTCMQVAISLGLYLSEKNRGAFQDIFMTFHSSPELLKLKGDIVQRFQQMQTSAWGMSTNLHSVFNLVLNLAVQNNVPQEDMPKIILILSDMQFNACVSHDDSAIQMIHRKYKEAGYQVPQVVFWNLNSSGNVPVSADKTGTALVSGFSPSIVKSILEADTDGFTPEGIMLKTIMNPRYDF